MITLSKQIIAVSVVLLAALSAIATEATAASLPETISSNTTLTSTGGPYTGRHVIVEKGVTLTIEAGTVVKLVRGLELNGELKVNGTSEDPVVFTSPSDDLHGGDTNEDGSETAPAAGDWFGIYFNGSASGYLHHVEVLYGGLAYAALPEVQIYCPCYSPPEISNSTFAHSANSAIEVIHGDPKIKGNTIDDNAGRGIVVRSASPEISENDISNNSAGIYFRVDGESHGDVNINDNVIEDNEGDGINVSATVPSEHIDSASLGGNEVRDNGGKAIKYEAYYSPIPSNISTNTLSENFQNGIWLAGKVEEDQTWDPSGFAFVVFGSFVIEESATLTLEPGIVVKGETGLEVYGALDSKGTVEDPVTFTSYRDDSVGGDTNGDGAGSEPTLGDWGGFYYPDAYSVFLSHLDIRYASTAFDIGYLDSIVVVESDFVYNKKAFEVASTAENDPVLGALPCIPPYLSFVYAKDDWFGKFGLPAPNIDISGAVGATLPGEYAPLFGAAATLAESNFSLYGTDNTIPYTIYSCPAAGIPPIPFTPVIVEEAPFEPHYPDPEA